MEIKSSDIVLEGVYSQLGYAKKIGVSSARVCQMVHRNELKLVFTEDGKPLIKVK